MDKGYLDYRIEDGLKTKNNLIHCIVDSKNSRNLKEDLEIWGREYKQSLITFISKDKAYEILLHEQTEKEVSADFAGATQPLDRSNAYQPTK